MSESGRVGCEKYVVFGKIYEEKWYFCGLELYMPIFVRKEDPIEGSFCNCTVYGRI